MISAPEKFTLNSHAVLHKRQSAVQKSPTESLFVSRVSGITVHISGVSNQKYVQKQTDNFCNFTQGVLTAPKTVVT